MPKGSSLLGKKIKRKGKRKNFYPLFRKMDQKERKKYFKNKCFASKAHGFLLSSPFQQEKNAYV